MECGKSGWREVSVDEGRGGGGGGGGGDVHGSA